MAQVEIRCPSCKSLFTVPWVQGSYAAVCMSCGKGIADFRPYLTQQPPEGASDSSKLVAGSAISAPSAPVPAELPTPPQPRQNEVLADLVRATQPQDADGNAPTVFGAKPVSDVDAAPPSTKPQPPEPPKPPTAQKVMPVSELETMKLPRDIASQPTKPLPKPPTGHRETMFAQTPTEKLKLGRVGHSLTGETKIRRRERLERGKKKVFESWSAMPGTLLPAGNSGHFAPPTATASKTRSISYRDLRSSSSTAYLDSLRAAAEAARVKKGMSKRVLPVQNSTNEVAELEKFLEDVERLESARLAAVSAAPVPGVSVAEAPPAQGQGTLSDLTFNTHVTKEVVVARDNTREVKEPAVVAELPTDEPQKKPSDRHGKTVEPREGLPPAAAAAAVKAAEALAPDFDKVAQTDRATAGPQVEKSSARMHIIKKPGTESLPEPAKEAPRPGSGRKSAAEIEEEADIGARRISTRTIIAKETEMKARLQRRDGPRVRNLGYNILAGFFYLFMFLSVVAFFMALVHQYIMPLFGLPRLK